MKLTDIEHSIGQFFEGSSIIQFLTPQHWYSKILFLVILYYLIKTILSVLRKMRNNCEYWTLPLFIVSLTFTLVLCLDSHCQKRKQSAQLEMVVPAGYRLLEYGEKIRSGDKGWYKGWYKEYDWVYYDMDFDKGFGNESKICNFAIRKIHY